MKALNSGSSPFPAVAAQLVELVLVLHRPLEVTEVTTGGSAAV